MNIKDSYVHNGVSVLKDIKIENSILKKILAGVDANGNYLDWTTVLDLTTIKPATAGTADKVGHKLTFTGGVTGDWDGSANKTVAIPTKASWNYDDVYLKDLGLDTGNSTDKNTSVSLTNGNVYLKLFKSINGAESEDSKVKIYGATNISVTTDSNGDIKITGVSSVTSATYAANVGTSGTVGTDYVTASNVISMYNWYSGITATDEASNTAIDKWNEIVSFLAGITDTSTLSGLLANYLPLSGGTLTGALTVPSLTVTGASSFSLAINGSILGNSATASRLLNARTINGTSFDGSANITITPSILAGTSNTNKVTIKVGNLTSSEYTIPYATTAGSAADSTKLPLAGGTMTSDAYISWGNNDRTDWDTFPAGIRVMSSITVDSGAPCLYASAINVGSRYSFQIAAQGGNFNNFFIRNSNNKTWHTIIHSGNISSLSVNYANSAGAVDWSNVSNKPGFLSGSVSGGGYKLNGQYIPDITISNDQITAGKAWYGMYGVYNLHILGHIWSIGTFYRISDDGKDPNSLYGLAYFHNYWSNDSNYNTNYTNKTPLGTYAEGHLVGWFANGVLKAALGSYIWSDGGFKKKNSSNDYVLLGGGGHKAVSYFLVAGDYVTIATAQIISGNKTFSGSTTLDDATIGNLVVTGAASFALTINGNITTADKVNHTLTFSNSDTFDGSADLSVTKSSIGLGNVENTKLSTWTGTNKITTVGTIGTGTWNGTTIGVGYGGTGKTSWTQYGIIYASATDTLSLISLPTWAASTTYWLKCVTNGSKVPTYSLSTISKSDVGLGNVDNTADTNKSVNYSNYTGYLNAAYITSEADITQSGIRGYVGQGSDWTGSIESMTYAAILTFGNPSRGWQMWARRATADGMYWRRGNSEATAWEDPRLFLDSVNYTSYTVTKTGTGASGTWGISITGNAGSANALNWNKQTSTQQTKSVSNAGWTETDTATPSSTNYGTYIVQLKSGNYYYSGVFSAGDTNDSTLEEIPLHSSAPSQTRLYLGTKNKKFYMSSAHDSATNVTFTLTYQRLL